MLRIDRNFIAVLITVGCIVTMNLGMSESLSYPPTEKALQTDNYHGTQVADPYRWLEDDVRESDEVEAWVEAQNELTFGYLKKLPHRQAIEDRLTELWNYEKIGSPFKRGD